MSAAETPMTADAALARLRQYQERTSTWSTATYDSGTERALHQIAGALAAEVEQLRARVDEVVAQRDDALVDLVHLGEAGVETDGAAGKVAREGEITRAEAERLTVPPDVTTRVAREALMSALTGEGALDKPAAAGLLRRYMVVITTDRRERLVAAESDLLDIRGVLAPNGRPRRVPMELGERVAPAVEWLTARVAELERAALDDEIQRHASAYRYLRDVIEAALAGDDGAWDDDVAEEQIYARYVQWLAARPSRDGVLAEVVDWLEKKAREYHSTGSRQHALQADAIETMADKIRRGAVPAGGETR